MLRGCQSDSQAVPNWLMYSITNKITTLRINTLGIVAIIPNSEFPDIVWMLLLVQETTVVSVTARFSV